MLLLPLLAPRKTEDDTAEDDKAEKGEDEKSGAEQDAVDRRGRVKHCG